MARHDEAWARLGLTSARRGWAGLRHTARVCTHAHGSYLPKAAAWPCRARGTDIPSLRHDAAAEGATAVAGLTSSAMAPAQKVAQRPDGRGSPRAGLKRVHRWPMAHAGSKG
jgi:hypothetical protein